MTDLKVEIVESDEGGLFVFLGDEYLLTIDSYLLPALREKLNEGMVERWFRWTDRDGFYREDGSYLSPCFSDDTGAFRILVPAEQAHD